MYQLGDYVWHDLNKDGIQDSDEPGVEGVKVILTMEDGTTRETYTDANGQYIFTDLVNGEYKVTFETPEGYTGTLVGAGSDTSVDSNGCLLYTSDAADDIALV